MLEFLIGPRWFFGMDTLFETFSIIVAFLIAIFAYKIYKLTSQKKYRNFSIAFLMISMSLAFKIISNLVIFYKTVEKSFYGLFTITYTQNLDFINIIVYSLYRLLMIMAFVMILISIWRIKDKKINSVLFIFSVILVLFSYYSYLLFNLILLLILGHISYYYFDNIKKHKNKNSYLVMLSFLALFISQAMFILFRLGPDFYALGESFQLIGFLFLMIAYISILRR